jgi:hypothetical protein
VTLALRLFWVLAWVSAVWLFLVGVFLSSFSAGPVAHWIGLEGRWAIVVLFALWGLHLCPLLALGTVATTPRGGVWRGIILLLCASVPLWVGVYALILRGDWGDAVLWGPYLITGVCLAALGVARLRRAR